jgi:hypothetical protein
MVRPPACCRARRRSSRLRLIVTASLIWWNQRGSSVPDPLGEPAIRARFPRGQLPICCITCLGTVLGLAEERCKLAFGEGLRSSIGLDLVGCKLGDGARKKVRINARARTRETWAGFLMRRPRNAAGVGKTEVSPPRCYHDVEF